VSALLGGSDDSGRHHEQGWSIIMKRWIGIVIVAMTVGAPTFAQSFEADNGSTVVALSARVHSKTISRHSGQQTYAMSPRRQVNINGGYSNNDNTGGGSPGYNEMLLNW
jgi:hypothetical protein